MLLSSFCTAFFISSFSLVNVYVRESYKLFESVNACVESGGAVGVSSLCAGILIVQMVPKENNH